MIPTDVIESLERGITAFEDWYYHEDDTEEPQSNEYASLLQTLANGVDVLAEALLRLSRYRMEHPDG